MISLLFSEKGTLKFKYDLNSSITIGRDPSQNTLALPDEDISRQHCQIEPLSNGAKIYDKSINGIFVKGKKVDGEIQLKVGDKLTIGNWEIMISEERTIELPQTVRRETKKTRVLGYNEGEKKLLVEQIVFDVATPDSKIKTFKFTHQDISIGSDDKSDLCLKEDGYISRLHCTFFENEGKYFLKDMNSTNGTYIDNQRIDFLEIPSKGQFTVGHSTIEYHIKTIETDLKAKKYIAASNFACDHPKMQNVLKLVESVAPSDAIALIRGESGVGKEEIARLLHLWGHHATGPFIAINCSALTEDVVESTLFGHIKGAFTGATSDHSGVFERADGGTLFLDEIGDLKTSMQGNLLRVLETKMICRMGDTKETPINVRIIAGTNKDLEGEIKSKRFREDLYYRLNIVPIFVPPLRERKTDIPKLIKLFLGKFPKNLTKKIDNDALALLQNYFWPGNIRQLKNYITQLVYNPHTGPVLKKEHIKLENYDEQCRTESFSDLSDSGIINKNMIMSLKEAEKKLIIETIRAFPNEDKMNIAKRLGIGRDGFRIKMKEYGIDFLLERTRGLKPS